MRFKNFNIRVKVNMKKLLSFIVTLAMVVGLAACGSTRNNKVSSSNKPAENKTSEVTGNAKSASISSDNTSSNTNAASNKEANGKALVVYFS